MKDRNPGILEPRQVIVQVEKDAAPEAVRLDREDPGQYDVRHADRQAGRCRED